MSRTIVRLSGFEPDDSAFYVNDWEQIGEYARFTVPIDHPLSVEVRDSSCRKMFTVQETEQFEWHIDRVQFTKYECRFTLISRRLLAKTSTVSDEFLVECGVVI
jgi:hypothetical protein